MSESALFPVSTVASESAFSTSGRVVDDFRSNLGVKTVEALICTQDWLRASNVCIDLEQLLEDVEKYEKGMLYIVFFLIFSYIFLYFI